MCFKAAAELPTLWKLRCLAIWFPIPLPFLAWDIALMHSCLFLDQWYTVGGIQFPWGLRPTSQQCIWVVAQLRRLIQMHTCNWAAEIYFCGSCATLLARLCCQESLARNWYSSSDKLLLKIGLHLVDLHFPSVFPPDPLHWEMRRCFLSSTTLESCTVCE